MSKRVSKKAEQQVVEQVKQVVAKAVKRTVKKVVEAAPESAPVVTAPVEAAPVEAAPNEPPPPRISDPEAPKLLKMTSEECLRIRLYESETVRYGMEAQLKQARRAAYLRQIDPNGELAKMEAEIKALSERSIGARKQYVNVVKAVEGRLSVKLSEYSFDDDTGILMPH